MLGHFVPGVPICLVIHGSFVQPDTHQIESAEAYSAFRRCVPHLPVHLIFYTWPSDAGLTHPCPLLVNQRGRWAENNAFYLADLIAQLPADSPICLVGHSHGARTTMATLHLVGGGPIDGMHYCGGRVACHRYRAVLAAAAFDRHWLNPGQRYELALQRAECVLNLQNRTDAALHFYPLRIPFSRKAFGTTGLTRLDRNRLGPAQSKLYDFDASRFIGLGHYWPHYYSNSAIVSAMVPYLFFTDGRGQPAYATAAAARVFPAGPSALVPESERFAGQLVSGTQPDVHQ
jgi:hypothetical protein